MNTFKEYYDNGDIKAKGIKLQGLKEGNWLYFSKEGKLWKEISYEKNIENGKWKMWHENGNLYLEQYKVNGKSEGYWNEYYENGKLKEMGEYRNDEYFPIAFWDEAGNQLLKNGTGKKIEKFGHLELDVVEQYYENGIFIKEIKIASAQFGEFKSNSNQ